MRHSDMLKNVFYGYIFLLPFISAFALSPTLTLSVLWSLVLFFFVITRKRWSSLSRVENALIFGLYLNIILSYVINGFLQSKPTNHLIAYTVTLLFFFVLINQVFIELEKKHTLTTLISKVLTYTILFASFFAIAEFGFKIYLGIDLNNFIPRPSRASYDFGALDQLFTRVRGFANESGQHAMMMETFLPVSSFYLIYRSNLPKMVSVFFITIFLLSLLFTFSGGAFLFFPMAILLTLAYIFVFRRIKLKNILMASFVIVLANYLFGFIFRYKITDVVSNIIFSKLNNSGSLNDRTNRFDAFLEKYQNADSFHQFFGYGPSGFRLVGLEDSILSLYPTVLFEAGVIGLGFFIAFLGYIYFIITQIKDPIKIPLMVGFLACCGHYWIVANYWAPWLWFLCAFILSVYREERSKKQFLLEPSIMSS